MTETWRAGDVAECIKIGSWHNRRGEESEGPLFGERCVVQSVEDQPLVVLTFGRYAPYRFNAARFRKVKPKADAPVAADRAFVDHMRLGAG